MLKLALSLFACLLGAGCTTIEVVGDDDSVRVERRFGFASVHLDGESPLVVARVRGIGYQSGPMGYALGYSNQSFAGSDGSCALVVWTEESTDLEELRQQLAELEGVCLVEQ